MNYDYLIWGNWDPIYLWVIFFVAIAIYALNKYDYGLDNLSDKKFKAFLIGCILFVGYYFLIYDPITKPVQKFLLTIINVMPSFNINLNSGPFLSLTILLIAGMLLFYIVKLANKKVISILPKKT